MVVYMCSFTCQVITYSSDSWLPQLCKQLTKYLYCLSVQSFRLLLQVSHQAMEMSLYTSLLLYNLHLRKVSLFGQISAASCGGLV